MASSQLSHLSLASTRIRPSIATFLLLLISVSLVPFVALSASELFVSTFPTVLYTLWDSFLGITTSSPFYFFLLNFLIVALVCSSGVLGPSSKHRHSAEALAEGAADGDDFYSAAQSSSIHETLGFDDFYGSQAPTPSYLKLTERSNVYVVEEEAALQYGDADGISNSTKPAISILLQHADPFTDRDVSHTMIFSPSSASKLDVAERSSMPMDTLEGNSPVSHMSLDDSFNGDLEDVTILHVADNNITAVVKDGQLDDEDEDEDEDEDSLDVRKELAEVDGADNVANGAESSRVNVESESGVADAESDGNNIKHNTDDHDEGDGDALQKLSSTWQQQERHAVEESRLVDDDDENVSPAWNALRNAGSSSEELIGDHHPWPRSEGYSDEAVEKKEKEKEEVHHEDIEMAMSREELNERASAFITAFRRKLISTAAIVDD